MPYSNPEQYKEYQKNYRETHRNDLTEYFRTYRQNNIDVVREKDRLRAAKKRNESREEVNAYLRAYKSTSEFKKKDLPRRLVNNQKRRARLFGAEGSHTKEEWADLKAKYEYRCLCCGEFEINLKNPLEQDHVIPLSKGGTNWITNIQPLCETCNGMGVKGTKSTDYRRSV